MMNFNNIFTKLLSYIYWKTIDGFEIPDILSHYAVMSKRSQIALLINYARGPYIREK